MKNLHSIVIKFTCDDSGNSAANEVVAAMFAQLEGLVDDFGVGTNGDSIEHETLPVEQSTEDQLLAEAQQLLALASDRIGNGLFLMQSKHSEVSHLCLTAEKARQHCKNLAALSQLCIKMRRQFKVLEETK